jgi:membrane protease subunit HflC
MKEKLPLFLGAISLALIACRRYSPSISVSSRSCFQLGEVRSVQIEQPGLHFKMADGAERARVRPRILTLDSTDPERFITSEKKNVLVDLPT